MKKKGKESHLLLQKLPSDTQLITTTGPLFADLVISKNNTKMSPSSLDICNYSVNGMRGLYEVLLAWRVGDPGAALESRQQLLRGCAPAAHQAATRAARENRAARAPRRPRPPAPEEGWRWGAGKGGKGDPLPKEVSLQRRERRLRAARGDLKTERGAKDAGEPAPFECRGSRQSAS